MPANRAVPASGLPGRRSGASQLLADSIELRLSLVYYSLVLKDNHTGSQGK